MKKWFISCGCFIFICILLTFFLSTISDKNVEKAADIVTEQINPSYTYVIKSYDGNIAIFENDSSVPFKIINVSVEELPGADRALLQTGIVAYNQSELNQILEDYCS